MLDSTELERRGFADAGDAQEDGEAGQHVGVDRTGFSLPADCLSEAASLARIDLDPRQTGLDQPPLEGRM
jgi:hypothetical protein